MVQELESAKSAGDLEVAKQPVDRYIMHLVWDYARYNQRRTLPDLVSGRSRGVSNLAHPPTWSTAIVDHHRSSLYPFLTGIDRGRGLMSKHGCGGRGLMMWVWGAGWMMWQVAGIQGGTAKIEEELKSLSAAFSEKQQAVGALKRKKGGTLATANLEEILTADVLRVRGVRALVQHTEADMQALAGWEDRAESFPPPTSGRGLPPRS